MRTSKRRRKNSGYWHWFIDEAGWGYVLLGAAIGLILSTISKALGF